jgi:hypothetical protein
MGLLKGLVIGLAIGAGITYGAHLSTPSGHLLAYLLAAGVGGTTGIFAGRAPWKDGAWIEASIKGVVGLVVALVLYWLGATYAATPIPWPGAAHPVPWTSLPLLYLAAIGALYGALVELDHDDGEAKPKAATKRPAAKARVSAADDTDLADEAPAATRAARKR